MIEDASLENDKVFHLTSIFTPAYNRAENIQGGVNGFRLQVQKPDVFNNVDCIASTITERENLENFTKKMVPEVNFPTSNETESKNLSTKSFIINCIFVCKNIYL